MVFLEERLLCACEVLPHGRMVSLLTDFNLVLAHPGQCLHRLIGVSPFGLVAWVGHILNRGGVVAVAERFLDQRAADVACCSEDEPYFGRGRVGLGGRVGIGR